MILKTAYKYQLADYKKPIAIYYGIIAAIISLVFFFGLSVRIFSGSTSTSSTLQIGAMDATTAVFLFVMGLNSFRESFFMLLQNGISRKTFFMTRFISSSVAAVIMAAIDNLLVLVGKGLFSVNEKLQIETLVEQLYNRGPNPPGLLQSFFRGTVFDLLMYLAVISLGFFITIIFYRLNQTGKVLIAAGLPVTLFVILPMVIYAKPAIGTALSKFLNLAFGISTANPYAAMLTFAIITLLLSLASWPILRRAVVK